jgi:cytochrome c
MPDFIDKHPLVMGLDFLSDGRLVMSTGIVGTNPREATKESAVYVISGLEDSDPEFPNMDVNKIADNFVTTIGVTIVNDTIYIADTHEFHRLTDNNNFSDKRTKILDWPFGLEWHHWGFTPVYWEGKFYAGLSGSIVGGGPSTTFAKADEAGSLWEFDLEGNSEVFASGFRQPNGLGLDPYGRIFVTTEQGSWIPSGGLTLIQKGFSYGHRHQPNTEIDKWPYKPYSVYIIYGENGASRSPGTPRYIPSGPYQGHWLYGDINHPGLMRVFMENVNGELQGAVFHFSHGTGKAAINRIEWGPDGALYMGCAGRVAGNWPDGNDPYPMYKLIPSDTTTFDLFSIRSRKNGMELEFTEAVDKSQQGSWNFEVRQWSYRREIEYGCCRTDMGLRDVKSVQVSDNGNRVFLEMDGLEASGGGEDKIVMIKVNGIKAASGTALWNSIGWYTLNSISESKAFDINGCTDIGYLEYNPNANFEDGTCITRSTKIHSHRSTVEMNGVKFGPGLNVSMIEKGPHSVTVLSPDGRVLAAVKGTGHQDYSFSQLCEHHVVLVRISVTGRTFTRKVAVF